MIKMGLSEAFPHQECIPVGCVPAAHRAYAGVCFLGGGVCLVWEGFSLVLGGLPGAGGSP